MINYHIILQVIREMWNCWACSKHNLTSKQLLNSLTIQLQTLKTQNVRGFFLLTSNNFFTMSQNLSAKKLCGGNTNTLKHFHIEKYQNDISKWPDIKNGDQRCHVVRRSGVSKTTVSLRYQLKRPCDVLSWLVLLKYQLVSCYDVSNLSVLFTH